MTTKLDSKPSRCGMAAKTAAGVPARMRASLPLEFFVVVVTYQRPFANCVDKKGEPSSCSLPGRSWSVAWADEDCPGRMAVGWVGEVHQPGMEHLADPRHLRCPRPHLAPGRQSGVHVKSAQDTGFLAAEDDCMTAAPISLSQALAAFSDVYSPRIIGRVNDYDVKVARAPGEHVCHVHEQTDEFFLVIDGRFSITLRDPDGGEQTVELRVGDIFFVVPRGTEHKPSSPGGAILMFEPSGTLRPGTDTKATSRLTSTAPPAGSRAGNPGRDPRSGSVRAAT